jgi:hypothetical protein
MDKRSGPSLIILISASSGSTASASSADPADPRPLLADPPLRLPSDALSFKNKNSVPVFICATRAFFIHLEKPNTIENLNCIVY